MKINKKLITLTFCKIICNCINYLSPLNKSLAHIAWPFLKHTKISNCSSSSELQPKQKRNVREKMKRKKEGSRWELQPLHSSFSKKVENLIPRNKVHCLLLVRKERNEFPPTVPRYPIFFFLPRKTWVSFTCDHILALPISSISSLHFSFTNQSKLTNFFFFLIRSIYIYIYFW